MSKLTLLGTLLAGRLLSAAVQAGAALDLGGDLDIPCQKFVLPNGLTLIVHEDRKAPIVAVNVWYHVGSKDEKPGRTGFAHLFEHLMFNGSENYNDDFFQALERVGATDMNGTTNEDRTNYFQNVPTSALDLVLWLESDRMGHLLGAVTQERLDEQRGVVQNEKRQGENQPYGRVYEIIAKATYPAGHPYSWTVIGSMEDLNAATLDDVKEWFRTYYGAANAVLVLAGDIDAATARAKVEKYFGHIPSGPPLPKHQSWIAPRTGTQRATMQDRVPQARIYKVWNVPPVGAADTDHLQLVSSLLASGKSSRLYHRLVYTDQIATMVSAYVDEREIGSQFHIVVTARPGEDLARVETALDEELTRFLAHGPSEQELQRVKTEAIAGFIRGIERIGGFGGKSDILAMSEVYGGSPDAWKASLQRTRQATPSLVHAAARRWLADGVFILEVHPFPEYATAASTVDRTKLPEPDTPPTARFPDLQRAALTNGLTIVLAERHAVPLVNCLLLVDAGYAADQFALPGTAKLAMDLLDEGTQTRSALQLSDELDQLGARLTTASSLDTSSVELSALKAYLEPSLRLFADVILNPAFPAEEFARRQKILLDTIQREKVQPTTMALRVLPRLLYGAGHAYGHPLTGSGTADAVGRITRADVEKFYQTWFKPNHATLVIVGDTTLAEILPLIERLFGKWQPGDVPRKNIRPVEPPSRPVVYLVDRPGSIQSIIFAGHVAPPKANPDEIALEAMNNLFGGLFTSRLNMNLREDKHWSYGARSFFRDARGQRPFIAYAAVQTDKTKESLAEVAKEFRGLLGDKPITTEELEKVKRQQSLELAGTWETLGAVGNSIAEMISFGLPADHFQTYAAKVRNLTLDQVAGAAKKVLRPDRLTWVVVGDRAKIESGIRELNFGEIRFLDADGNPVD